MKMNPQERQKLIELTEQILNSKGYSKVLAWAELQQFVKTLAKKYEGKL